MSVPTGGRSATTREEFLARRDLSLDLVRTGCLLFVVLAHVCFVALRTTPDGGMENWTPPQQLPFFATGSWFFQPMPLFFVVGGYVSLTAWRSAQRRGEDGFAFFRVRLLRFAGPAAGFFGILGVILGITLLAGVPRSLTDAAAFGVGTPLWFMGAYLLCQAALPLLSRAHATRPFLTAGLLLAGAVIVDLVRLSVGIDAIGLLNYLFVWPFAQQVGFFLADGWLTPGPATEHRRFALRRRHLLAGAALTFVLVGVIATLAPYGGDMLQNQIPPTLPLALIGLAHALIFAAVRPQLAGFMQHRVPQAVAFVVGSRGMTLYLWHGVFVIGIAALFFFTAPLLPQAPSAGWWLSRSLVFATVLGLVWLLSLGVGRFERAPDRDRLPPTTGTAVRLRIAVAGVLAVIPAFVTTIPAGEGRLRGLDTMLIMVGAVLVLLAIGLARWPRIGRRGGPEEIRTRRGSGSAADPATPPDRRRADSTHRAARPSGAATDPPPRTTTAPDPAG